jgi:hypothetical protein
MWLLIFLGGAAALAWRIVSHDEPHLHATPPSRPPRMPQPGGGSGNPIPVPIAPLPPTTRGPVYNTESWRPYLTPLAAAAGIPIEYALQHVVVESGGNPCAVGNPFASFDGGKHPREAGIAQLYGPDDYATTKADPDAFRAYCAPSYMSTYKDANGVAHQAMAFSQSVTRALTSEEMIAQASSLIALITASRHRADRLLASVGATWPPTSGDYWKFVKLQHGIPGLANAIVYVRDTLGRAPLSWAEFAATVVGAPTLALIQAHDPNTYAYAGSFAKVLANAEKTGGVVQGPALS